MSIGHVPFHDPSESDEGRHTLRGVAIAVSGSLFLLVGLAYGAMLALTAPSGLLAGVSEASAIADTPLIRRIDGPQY